MLPLSVISLLSCSDRGLQSSSSTLCSPCTPSIGTMTEEKRTCFLSNHPDAVCTEQGERGGLMGVSGLTAEDWLLLRLSSLVGMWRCRESAELQLEMLCFRMPLGAGVMTCLTPLPLMAVSREEFLQEYSSNLFFGTGLHCVTIWVSVLSMFREVWWSV